MHDRVCVIAVLLSIAVTGAVKAQSDETFGRFTYVQRKDQLDDSNRSYIMTVSDDQAKGEAGSLAWKCMEDGLNVLYLFNSYMSGDSDDEVIVRTRFDGEAASGPVYWGLVQSKRAAYIPLRLMKQFTERAKTSRTVILRVVDPLDGETITHTFSLTGLAAALNRLGTCH